MKSALIQRINEVKARRPRNKIAALDRLATDLGLMDNVIYVDFKNKKKVG